jgi:hypothetical protein
MNAHLHSTPLTIQKKVETKEKPLPVCSLRSSLSLSDDNNHSKELKLNKVKPFDACAQLTPRLNAILSSDWHPLLPQLPM